MRHVSSCLATHTIVAMSDRLSLIHLPAVGLALGIIIGLTGVGGSSLMPNVLVGELGIPNAVAVRSDLPFPPGPVSIDALAHRPIGSIANRLLAVLIASSLAGTAHAVARFINSSPILKSITKTSELHWFLPALCISPKKYDY